MMTIRERWLRFGSDSDGQITLFAVVSAAAFACLLLLIMNTGYGAAQKIEMQNAADATAISSATWVARGLNLVSMNNVAQTQLLALAIIIPALHQTVLIINGILAAQLAAATACAATVIGAPVCGPLVTLIGYEQTYAGYLTSALSKLQKIAKPPNGTLWKMMKAIGGVSKVTLFAAPGMSFTEALRIAKANAGQDAFGLVVTPTVLPSLPLQKGTFQDLCDPTRSGSPGPGERGYMPLLEYKRIWQIEPHYNVGPLHHYGDRISALPLLPFVTLLGTQYLIFEGVKLANYSFLCSGSAESFPIENFPGNLSDCIDAGDGRAKWMKTSVRTIEYTRSNKSRLEQNGVPASDVEQETGDSELSQSCKWEPRGMTAPSSVDQECEYKSGYWGDGKICYLNREVKDACPSGAFGTPGRCPYQKTVGYDDKGRPIKEDRYRYDVTEYAFKEATFTKEMEPGDDPYEEAGASDRPFPYLLKDPENVPDKLRYFGFVHRKREVAWGRNVFLSPWKERRLSYGQAKVYNGTAFDMFTQDWRVKMMPADLLGMDKLPFNNH